MMRKTGFLIGFVLVFGGWAFGQSLYDENTLTTLEEWADWYETQVVDLPPVPGPNEIWLRAVPTYMQVSVNNLPPAFIDGLIPHEEYGFELYDLFIIPDPLAAEWVFYNEIMQEIGVVEYAFDDDLMWPIPSFMTLNIYEGVYALSVTLVDESEWMLLQAAQEKEAEALAQEAARMPMPAPMMRGMDGGAPPDPAFYIHAEFDNLKVERPSVARDTLYTNNFDSIPDEMRLRAVPDNMSVYRSWSSSRHETTYITNNRVIVMPSDGTWQGTWLNPMRNYQNASRMNFQAGSEVNIAVNYSDFNQGVAKICFLPEDFPAEVWGHYDNQALYVEMWRASTNIVFTAYHHLASGDFGRECIGQVTNYTAYADGCMVNVSITTNSLQVVYDGETMLNLNHGISSMTNLYCNGMCPHFEFQNNGSSTNAVIGMDEVTVSSVN